MSQGRKYKGARKSRSFKPIGGGLRASEERIKEQARTVTSGLEFALASQKRVDKLKIDGFADKVAFNLCAVKGIVKLIPSLAFPENLSLVIIALKEILPSNPKGVPLEVNDNFFSNIFKSCSKYFLLSICIVPKRLALIFLGG